MKKSAITQSVLMSVMGLSLLANTANANEMAWQEKPQQEKHHSEKHQEDQTSLTGFGSGAVAGAVVAGPVGAVVGGIFGIFVAEDINHEKRNQRLANKLSHSETELLALQQEYHNTLIALKALEAKQSQVQVAALPRHSQPLELTGDAQGHTLPVESNIQFKTDSYQLEQHYLDYLDDVAAQLKAQPDMVVQLFGYADRRGEAGYNQSLSEKRAGQVKTYLISIGVSQAQIETTGYGEAQPVAVNQNHENDFFDRRVVLRIDGDTSVMTAKQ